MICHSDNPEDVQHANYICFDCYCELDIFVAEEEIKKNSEEE